MTQPRHKLSNKDLTSREAVCSICGPVRISVKGGKARCRIAINLSNRKKREDLSAAGLKPKPSSSSRKSSSPLVLIRQIRERLALEQDGKCKICQRVGVPLVLDHCHTSGMVRGVICNPCNHNLGFYREDPAVFEQFIAYIAAGHLGIPWPGRGPDYQSPYRKARAWAISQGFSLASSPSSITREAMEAYKAAHP